MHCTSRNHLECIKSFESRMNIQESQSCSRDLSTRLQPCLCVLCFLLVPQSCRGAQLSVAPTAHSPGAGMASWLWGNTLQSLRAEMLGCLLPNGGHRKADRLERCSLECAEGNKYCNISGKREPEVQGVTQLCSSSPVRIRRDVSYSNCCLLEQHSSKCGWEAVKQMCKKW